MRENLLVAFEFFFVASTFFNAIQSNILRIGGIYVALYSIFVYLSIHQHASEKHPRPYLPITNYSL